jgi:hypothetical protein
MTALSAKPSISPTFGICCRQIVDADVPAVAALLAHGFPSYSVQFWAQGVQQLGRLQSPAGLPKYGYLLESEGRVVGTLLLIFSQMRAGDEFVTRCNVSSWYVEPTFRVYAPLLTLRAHAAKNVTYLNVSPHPDTHPILKAQGFSCYCDGKFVAVPILHGLFGGSNGVKVFDARVRPTVGFDPFEQEILLQHAKLGCISLWCTTSERAYPFVFRPRRIKKVIPGAQLIYCRDTGDFVRFARPLGRALARLGTAFVVIDANSPIPGLYGVFRPGNDPKYYRGPQRPRLGDLAYTECAVLGV